MYDIATTSIFETTGRLLSRNLPFVVFSEPNSTNIRCFYQTEETIHHFDEGELGFIVAPFAKQLHNTFIIPSTHTLEWKISDNNEEYLKATESLRNTKALYNSNEKRYKGIVKKALEYIHKNTLEKVVVARKECILSNINFVQSFLKSLEVFPNAFNYVWYHPKIGMWIGASPEQLFSIKNYIFKTVSLASTKDNKSSKKKWSEKEYLEQEIVTKWIERKLKQHRINAKTKGPETYQIGELIHLKTNLEGTVSNHFNALSFLEDFHPTPAVCGTPLEEASQFIHDYEEMNRVYYTGFIGIYEGAGLQSYYVNIRCAELKPMETILYSGCGIVKGSDPGNEWKETVSKMKSIKNILVGF